MSKAKTPEAEAAPANTNGEKLRGRPFVPGQIANPAGRPKGSRNKLGEAFILALHDDFANGGAEVIARVREEDPAAYVRVIAGLLPKEFKIETAAAELTDEQLNARIRALADVIGIEVGVRDPAGGIQAQGGSNTAH